MKKRPVRNERFYTTPDNVEWCLGTLDLSEFDLIVEPSAGAGAFSSQIPGCVAMDIDPQGPGIEKRDFFDYMPDTGKYRKILTVGNPPFGRQSSLAIKFIKHAAKFSDTIAFILPNSFYKESMVAKLPSEVVPEFSTDLDDNMFIDGDTLRIIPCSFFVFNTHSGLREPPKVYTTEDFKFVKKSDNPDNSIRRVGRQSGRIGSPEASAQSHYFVKWLNPNAKQRFSKIKWVHDNTVGPRSISKNEMIAAYLGVPGYRRTC